MRGRCLLRDILSFGKSGLLAICGTRLGKQQGGRPAGTSQCYVQYLEARGDQPWRKQCLGYKLRVNLVRSLGFDQTIERFLVLARRTLRGNV